MDSVVFDQTLMWQLLDTSIKVGLGAIIVGAFSWALMRRQQSANAVSRLTRRMELFEDISKDVGNVNHIFSKYSSLVI